MATEQKKKPKKKVMPVPSRRQNFKDALASTNKQFAETLSRLAK